jgi:hypothetical protein
LSFRASRTFDIPYYAEKGLTRGISPLTLRVRQQ